METITKRRYEPRLPVHMAAKITAPGQVSPAPCVVRQISQAGARLQIVDGWIIPPTFWLLIDGDTRLHYCVVVWREGTNLGVEFPPGHDGTWWRHSRATLNKQLPNRNRI